MSTTQVAERSATYALEREVAEAGDGAFDLLAIAPQGVAKVRELILSLAVQGKLVMPKSGEASADDLVQRAKDARSALEASRLTKAKERLAAAQAEPFELPRSWTWVALADICASLTDGDHLPPPKTDSGVPFLVIGDVRSGSVNLVSASRFVPRTYFDELDWSRRPKAGDILYTTVGSYGIPIPLTADEDFCFQRHIALIRPALAELQGFLALFLASPFALSQATAAATGIAQKTVPLSGIRRFNIPLPPLAEQRRIVARVEKLMWLCDALEAKGRLQDEQHARLLATLLDTLVASTSAQELAANWQRIARHFDLLLDRPAAVDALEQTILQLAVRGLLVPQDPADEPICESLAHIHKDTNSPRSKTQRSRRKNQLQVDDGDRAFREPQAWQWLRIGEFCDVQGGIQKTPQRRPVSHHFPYLRVANVQRGSLKLDEIARYELAGDELERWRLHVGDLLVVEGNGSEDEIGRCAIWDGSIDPCVFQNHLIRVRPYADSMVQFVTLFLNSPDGITEMKRLAITTSGLFNLSVGKIRNIAIPLPPLAEQHRIVAKVEQLRGLCAKLRQRLQDAEATQTALADALVDRATEVRDQT